MTYLYIVLTLVLILQLLITAYFIFLVKCTSNQVLDVNKVIITLRKLQEEGRIYINADHGIKFIPVFNSIVDKDRTLLKIDLTAENTRFVINDPEIIKSIEDANRKEIEEHKNKRKRKQKENLDKE